MSAAANLEGLGSEMRTMLEGLERDGYSTLLVAVINRDPCSLLPCDGRSRAVEPPPHSSCDGAETRLDRSSPSVPQALPPPPEILGFGQVPIPSARLVAPPIPVSVAAVGILLFSSLLTPFLSPLKSM